MAESRGPFRLGKLALSEWQRITVDKPQAELAGRNTGAVRVVMDRVQNRWVATRVRMR